MDAVQTVSPGRAVTLNTRSTRLSALQPCQEVKKRKHETHKQEKGKSSRNMIVNTEYNVIGNAKNQYAQTWHQNSDYSIVSVLLGTNPNQNMF